MSKLLTSKVIFKDFPAEAEDVSGVNGPLFTAIPVGPDWQVKAISPKGDVVRIGKYSGRLAALGAAAAMAECCGGQVVL